MSVFILPLVNVPQRFEIALAGGNYIMVCKWNDAPDAGWAMDILNATDNTPIVANIPLIVGADLLEGLGYLGINGQMVVYTDGDAWAPPTLENLGIESNVYFQTDIEDV